MKAILMLLIVLVVMLFTVSITPTPAPDSDEMTYIVAITPTTAVATSWYCDGWWTYLSPTLQRYCYTEWMMDRWDPLDWG